MRVTNGNSADFNPRKTISGTRQMLIICCPQANSNNYFVINEDEEKEDSMGKYR
jgi:hypothetical protein